MVGIISCFTGDISFFFYFFTMSPESCNQVHKNIPKQYEKKRKNKHTQVKRLGGVPDIVTIQLFVTVAVFFLTTTFLAAVP